MKKFIKTTLSGEPVFVNLDKVLRVVIKEESNEAVLIFSKSDEITVPLNDTLLKELESGEF